MKPRHYATILVVGFAGCGLFGGTTPPPDVPPCKNTSECVGGLICANGGCRAPGFAAAGTPCAASRECASNLFCAPDPKSASGASCAPAGAGMSGDPCSSDGNCGVGLRCNLAGFSGTCAVAGMADQGDPCTGSGDCIAGLYCGAAHTCAAYATAFPPWKGVDCKPDEDTFHSFFEVPRPPSYPADFFRLPFPNAARIAADGSLDLHDFPDPGPTPLGVDLAQLYVSTWSKQFAGFGAAASIAFRFSKELDFNTATPESIKLVDLTAGGGFGQEVGRAWGYTTARNNYECQQPFNIRSQVSSPLAPRHTYGALLLTGLPMSLGIKGKDGTTPKPDPDLLALLSAGMPGDAALARAWKAYQPLRDYLAMKSLAPTQVANATVFTVQDTVGGMAAIAASVAQQPAPMLSSLTLCDAGVKSPCDDGTPARACVAASPDFYEIHGKVSMPIYQAGTPPYQKPPDGGGIVFDGSGVPRVQRTEAVCFALAVPKKPLPMSGWPLLVYAHGTNGSMRDAIGVAATVAKGAIPMAVLGFDEVEHGARRGGSTASPNDLVFNALNPDAARDNFVQGAADILSALRVAGVDPGTVPTVGAVKFDPSKVAFFGHSQGATSGSLALAYSPTPVAIFSGAGAFLTDSLLNKTSPVNIAAGMQFLFGDQFGDDHPVMNLFQSYFERADPLNYNLLLLRAPPMGVPSKHLYMSWGLGDTFAPPVTLQRNAESLGLPQGSPKVEAMDMPAAMRPVSANADGGDGKKRTAAYFKYSPSGYDGHFVATRNSQAIADWSGFLQSWLGTGTPTVN